MKCSQCNMLSSSMAMTRWYDTSQTRSDARVRWLRKKLLTPIEVDQRVFGAIEGDEVQLVEAGGKGSFVPVP